MMGVFAELFRVPRTTIGAAMQTIEITDDDALCPIPRAEFSIDIERISSHGIRSCGHGRQHQRAEVLDRYGHTQARHRGVDGLRQADQPR
jgi:hypothetical protein